MVASFGKSTCRTRTCCLHMVEQEMNGLQRSLPTRYGTYLLQSFRAVGCIHTSYKQILKSFVVVLFSFSIVLHAEAHKHARTLKLLQV